MQALALEAMLINVMYLQRIFDVGENNLAQLQVVVFLHVSRAG